MDGRPGSRSAPALLRLQLDSRHDAFLTEPWVQVASNGDYILCQCGDKVNVLSCTSGQVVHSLESKEDALYTLKLSPDQKLLATSHTSGLLRLWDWKNNEMQRVWKSLHIGPIPTLSFDETATLVASGGVDGTIKVWDIVRHYCTHSLKGSVGVVSTVEFFQHGKEIFIYGSGDDNIIRCWNLMTSEVTQELKGHFSKVSSLSIEKTQMKMVSCGRDKVLMLWDITDGSLIRTVATHEAMECAVLVPAGISVAHIESGGSLHAVTGGERGALRVWNMDTSLCVYKQGSLSGAVSTICQICYTPSSQLLTVVNHEHNILQYDISTAELKHQYVGFSDEILDIVFMGKNDTHIAVATNSSVIKIYEVATFDCQLVKGHSDTVLALSVSPTNKNLFLSSSKDNMICLWQLTEAERVVCLAVGAGHTESVTSVCWSSLSGGFLVSGAEDKCVKVWDVPALPKKVPSEPAALHCQRTEVAHDKDINAVAVSPNDRLIVTASQDKTARVYATEGLTLQGVLRGHRRGIWAITFSPVDQVVATASADCSVRLWSISDFSCVKMFEGHDSSVLRVMFLCRGMQLMTCSADGLLKLWSVKANECLQTCSEHEAKVWALAVSGDEKHFVSGGADSALLVWRDVHEEENAADVEAAALRATQEQALANLVQQKQWLRALKLAIRLKRPFRCLQILKEVRRGSDSEQQLSTILTQLRDDQVDDLLLFAVEWNTNSKHCHEAQLVVSLLLKLRSPEEWRRLPSFRAVLEGLLPYTERHMERMGRLLQSITFLDYTAACMKVTSRTDTAALSDVYPDEYLFTELSTPANALGSLDDVKDEEGAGEAASAPATLAPESSEDSGLEAEEPAKSTETEQASVKKRALCRKTPSKVCKKKKRQVQGAS